MKNEIVIWTKTDKSYFQEFFPKTLEFSTEKKSQFIKKKSLKNDSNVSNNFSMAFLCYRCHVDPERRQSTTATYCLYVIHADSGTKVLIILNL